MNKVKLIFLAVVTLCSVSAVAEPILRDVQIERIHPMAVDRTHCPTCSGVTRIYVNKAAWGNSNCRNDAGDLLKEDDHLLSILLTAWIAGKSVKLEVNDQAIPIGDVCKITAAFIE